MRLILLPLICLLTLSFPCSAAELSATVIRVVDGDTIDLKLSRKIESVRLIGVDTPESRDNDKARRDSARNGMKVATITAQGKRAAAFVAALVPKNSSLTLEYDIEKRDHYGRLLAYAYLPDGRMLNELIISSGYAALMTIPPNVRHVEKFKEAYAAARKAKVGLWAE